jgi:hypothetical protein
MNESNSVMQDDPEDILEAAKQLYSDKEEDYGESWRLTGEILSLIIEKQGKEEITIPSDPEYLIALGLYTRRLDKLVRSFNGTFIQDDLEVDETISETVKDQVPYSAMHTTIAQEMTGSSDAAADGGIEMVDDETFTPSPPGTPDYEYCSECGEQAVERTNLMDSDENYEYYCTCGHAWWGS